MNIDRNLLTEKELEDPDFNGEYCVYHGDKDCVKGNEPGFNKKNLEIRLKIFTTVQKLPDNERMIFIKNCFNNNKSIMLKEFAIELLKFVPENQVDSEFISQNLRLNGHGFSWWGIVEGAISAIKYAPQKDRFWLIKRAYFTHPFYNFYTKSKAIKIIKYLPNEQQYDAIKPILKSIKDDYDDDHIRLSFLEILPYMLKKDLLKLNEDIDDTADSLLPPRGIVYGKGAFLVLIKSIKYVSTDKITPLIQKTIKHMKFLETFGYMKDIESLIKYAPEGDQKELTKQLNL